MTIQEILDLGKMGYTKEDIEKMGEDKQEPQKQEPQKQEPQKQEPQKQEPQKQEPQKQEPQKQEPQKQEPQKQKDLDNIAQLTESINSLIASIQTANILKTNNHSGEDESAEEILGSIIMPPLKKGEKTK